MLTGQTTNEHGVSVSLHRCETCGVEFSLTPAPTAERMGDWHNCLAEGCASYDPHRDADILFMSDAEIVREKSVVSIQKLRERAIIARAEGGE